MLSTGFFMVHDALVSSQDESTELTGWEDGIAEVLEVPELDIEVGGNNSTLVESSIEVYDDLSTTGIIDDLKLTNVSVLLHDFQELDECLGDWSEDNLNQISRVSTKISQNQGELEQVPFIL